ncbi:hypothetical protein [Paenibacillus donghaensis]|uniref:Uncharacterized protein n=1 Tax=Paenibacillus donghaensis TaxID=414771 RepID=A0A2Z2KHE4_9BACL|nr:hypothetical protein [Paenibacillus donghaensis]ASA22600.1 hypothetical protein B9T62_18510 [Paenibacillus donghaensis]
MAKINTDQNFFNRFRAFQIDIQHLSSTFQNSDIEITPEGIRSWNQQAKNLQSIFDEIIDEANERMGS